jgi:hypothetical protein
MADSVQVKSDAPDNIVLYYTDPREPVEIRVVLPGDVTCEALLEAFVNFAARVGYAEKSIEQAMAGWRA